MARIGSYPIDAVVHDKDAWIGTENTNRVTRQFTAKGIAEYIDTKNVGLVFVGATALADGKKGLVPAPVAGQEGMYLKGDLGGGWTTIPVYTLDVPAGTTNVNLINTDGAGAIINSFITLTGGTYLTSVHTSGSQITFNHDNTTRSDTTSAASPAAGASVPLVASVTSNATGHITAIDVKTVTWPADSDTTYTIDVPNATTSINLAGSDGTNDPIAFTTVAGNNGMTISRTDANTLNFNSKWQANTVNTEGYVSKGQANANKFWATDANGNPGWTFQPSQDQTLTSTGTTNASTGVVLSQNGGTVIIKGDGSTINASSNNTTNTITLAAINRVNTTYTLPVAAGGANTAVINLTDNSSVVSSVTFNGTANKISISETAGNNGDITIGMPDDVTVTGELTVSGTGQSSFGGQITIPQTPVADTDAASKKYVDDLVSGGLTFRGTFRADTGEILSGVNSGSQLYNCPGGAGTRIAVAVGDYYIVATAGGSFYCSGATLDIGDSIIATAAANADASVVTGWSVVQSDEGVASFTNANGTFVSAGTVNSNATGAVTMGTIDLSATGTKDGTTFLRGDNTWAVPAYVSYSAMTTSTLGLGKIKYDFGSTPAAESQSTTTARTYGVTKNASDQLVVNVPWVNSSDVNSVTASGAATALSGLTSTPNTGSVVIGLDINGRASLGTPASDDELMIYDTSTAKNVKVLVSDLASYAGSAATNQVTYWTSANEIGGATGFTFAGGANGAVVMGGTLSVASDVTATGIYTAGNSAIIYKAQRSGGAVAGDWSYDDATTDMSLGTSTAHSFSLKTGDTRALTIDTSGNVGIGLTPDASYSKLQVKTPASSYGLDLVGRDAGSNSESQITFWNAAQTTVQSAIYNVGQSLHLYVAGDDRLVIDSSGNSTFAGNLIIHNSTNAPYIDFVENADTGDSKARITMDQIDTNNGSLLFATEGGGTLTERMRIDSSGQVIFKGTGNGVDLRFKDISAAISSETAGYIGMSTSAYSGNNGDLVLIPRTSAASNILLMQGNVGIGTTSPGYTFTVNKSITNDWLALFGNTYNGAGNGVLIDAGDGSSGEILRLRDKDGNNKVHFLSNGNVGIGTDSPFEDLEIYSDNSSPTLLVKAAGQTSSTTPTASLFLSPGSFSSNATAPRIIGYRTADFSSAAARSAGLKFGVAQNNVAKDAMWLSETGYLGIGTASPDNILHIETSNAGGPQIQLESTSGTASAAFINFDSTSLQLSTQRDMIDGDWYDTSKSWGGINIQGPAGGSFITFHTAAASNSSPSERMRIDSNGTVEIPGGNSGIAQSIAKLDVRVNGSAIEFGHTNNSDWYYGTLGAYGSAGNPFISFSTFCELSDNRWTTQGSPGNIIMNDNGNLIFQQVTSTNSTAQAAVDRMRITSGGYVIIGGTAINGAFGASNTILAVQGTTSGGEGIIQITGKGNNATDNVGKIDFHSYSEADPMCSIRSVRGSGDDQGELQIWTNNGGTPTEKFTVSKEGLVYVNKEGYIDGGFINGFRTAIQVGQSAVAIGKVATYGGLAMVWMNYAGNIGYDLVSYSLSQVTVLSSQTISGGTSSRTYTSVSGILKLTMGGSDTYAVYATEMRTANT